MNIRTIEEEDYPAIIAMLKEFAIFQKVPGAVTNTPELMKQEKAFFNCFVAVESNGEIAGMATYFYAYYTWSGKSIYLDDLYVKEAYRGQNIGKRLLDKIFEVAKNENCKRVRWLVSEWNTSAIEFYKKCGATIDKELYLCDFDEERIDNYLKQLNSK